jgi:hypothetical protein
MSSLPPLWKQIAGAVVGGTLALGLYAIFDITSPLVQAYIGRYMEPRPSARLIQEGAYANIAERTQDILQEQQEPAPLSAEAVQARREERLEQAGRDTAVSDERALEGMQPAVSAEEVQERREERLAESARKARRELAATESQKPAAPALPSSGLGTTLGAIAALLLAASVRSRRAILRLVGASSHT